MKKARTLLGIDEAGRGCVLGPMVFGAFLSTDEVEQQLRAEGVRDSKRLSKKKRALLAQRFQDAASDLEKPGAWGRHETVSIPPSRLDSGSLNEIGKEVVVELTLRFRPDVLILDAPVPPRGLKVCLPRQSSQYLHRPRPALLEGQGTFHHRMRIAMTRRTKQKQQPTDRASIQGLFEFRS